MSCVEFKESQFEVESKEGEWKSVNKFHAKVPLGDHFFRAANYGVMGAAVFGAYGFVTGPMGAVSCIALAPAARKVISTALGYFAYPAALNSFPWGEGNYLKRIGESYLSHLRQNGCFVKKVSLVKSGTKYDAVLIGNEATIDNGKWTVHALGDRMAMEGSYVPLSRQDHYNNSNTMLINGPSVCGSGGCPTRYQMGAGFEAGLQFLENAVRATHIAMHGYSLGAGMMSEAILNHEFMDDVQYLFIADRTFTRLSDFASVKIGRFVKPIFLASGMELDCIAASKKLDSLKISQIVIQHKSKDGNGTDGMVPDSVSFVQGIYKSEAKKVVFLSEEILCENELPLAVSQDVNREIQEFFRE